MILDFKTDRGIFRIDAKFIEKLKPHGIDQTIIEYYDDMELISEVVNYDYEVVKKLAYP